MKYLITVLALVPWATFAAVDRMDFSAVEQLYANAGNADFSPYINHMLIGRCFDREEAGKALGGAVLVRSEGEISPMYNREDGPDYFDAKHFADFKGAPFWPATMVNGDLTVIYGEGDAASTFRQDERYIYEHYVIHTGRNVICYYFQVND